MSVSDGWTATPTIPVNGVAGSQATLPARLADAHVDLVAMIDAGLPERAWLPASAGMLAKGKRHHVAAPLKSGKTLSQLAHIVNMTMEGASVVILDRENGAEEYSRRLQSILLDRPAAARDAVRQCLAYYAWPRLIIDDGEPLARAFDGVDLVLFDSTRTFLSSLGLKEDQSDDFASFASGLIDPLFRAGIATVQLDNSGHADKSRGRGSSSKGDLADVIYSLETTDAFDANTRGSVTLTRQHSRFGDVLPAFAMTLGDGHFGRFEPAASDTPAGGTFRPTHLMEKLSEALEHAGRDGLNARALRAAVKGNNDAKELARVTLIDEGYIRLEHHGQAHRHHSLRPYREADETPTVPPCPDRAQPCPGTGAEDRAPVPLPIGARGTGHGPTDDHRAPGHGHLPSIAQWGHALEAEEKNA